MGISLTQTLQSKLPELRLAVPGFLICLVVAATAQFLSDHYGAPAMLMALLLGIALNFLGEEGRAVKGIALTAKTVLRIGVALLGARISVDLLMDLGPQLISLVVGGVILTILFALTVGKLFGFDSKFSFLTGGSVAICGASAAMAIGAILPKNNNDSEGEDFSERNLIFTVLGVTVLSTIAMVLYPILSSLFEFDTRQSGVFLGGTIHDVAQVVGAGFSISNETGEVATLVKLIRVTMLAPVVLVATLVIRARYNGASQTGASKPPLLPMFVIMFLILAGLNSAHLIPQILVDWAGVVSRWALLTSIAAVGMKTSLGKVLEVGGPAIGLIVLETIFIAGVIIAGLQLLT
ncbi:YeiH family protein [Cohaesibacter gelatinilyticus]|uniref:Conserved hypothetical integral membrane protein n=1 Tax=Cohaesibacter gelatinilyticus TaxID=372072 RepID=A0A285PFX6_9HYPH|nr:YeiH family protein [Cohaesibacter gelatinilyticus]SNZ20630.1 conserved hypothetical integral membrane protein [Cohaesibacter gelatinilyticus]